MLFKTRFWYRK